MDTISWIFQSAGAFYLAIALIIVGPIIQFMSKDEINPAEIAYGIACYLFIYMKWWSVLFIAQIVSVFGLVVIFLNLIIHEEINRNALVFIITGIITSLLVATPLYYNSMFYESNATEVEIMNRPKRSLTKPTKQTDQVQMQIKITPFEKIKLENEHLNNINLF